MASASTESSVGSMHPDAPATKRDLNEMAGAIMGEMNERFDEVNDRLVTHEALLIIIAHKLDIPDADIDRALTPPPRP